LYALGILISTVCECILSIRSYIYIYIYIKVKWSRYRSGVAQRVGRCVDLLFHDRGTRRGWVVSSTPRRHFTLGKDPVPILQDAGWAPSRVWTGGKSRPHRDSIPDRPARNQSLYRLSYPAHTHTHIYIYIYIYIHTYIHTYTSLLYLHMCGFHVRTSLYLSSMWRKTIAWGCSSSTDNMQSLCMSISITLPALIYCIYIYIYIIILIFIMIGIL